MAPVRLIQLPLGEAGTQRTVNEMRQAVKAGLQDPLVVEQGRRIVRECLPRDMKCRALSVRRWMVEHFMFERDPIGVELLMTPRYMLDKVAAGRVIQGDCDDAAIMSATLGMAIGLRARFVLFGFRQPNAPFSHVFTELRVGNQWVQQDVTRPPRARPASRVGYVEV